MPVAFVRRLILAVGKPGDYLLWVSLGLPLAVGKPSGKYSVWKGRAGTRSRRDKVT